MCFKSANHLIELVCEISFPNVFTHSAAAISLSHDLLVKDLTCFLSDALHYRHLSDALIESDVQHVNPNPNGITRLRECGSAVRRLLHTLVHSGFAVETVETEYGIPPALGTWHEC